MKRKFIKQLLTTVFLFVFIACAFQLGYRFYEEQEYLAQRNTIQQIISRSAKKDSNDSKNGIVTFDDLEAASKRDAIFHAHHYLSEENEDYVGWLSIPDTNIDYPVMQNKEIPDYYLYRDFEKKKRSYGSIYLDSACRLHTSMNNVLYGHHMKNGSMFSALSHYESEDFYKEHPTILFDSLYEQGDYEIVAAFKISANKLHTLASFILLHNKEQFEEFKQFVEIHQLYDTGIDYQYGDKLLTLMTCDYSYRGGRIFIVARKTN